MIQRLAQFFGGEVRGIHNAAYLLAGFAVLSSLLGFFRDRLLAHVFGAGPALDLYHAAFRLPDLVFVCVASLVSAYVLIPEFVRREEDARRGYIEGVLLWFCIGIIAVSVLAYLAAPAILALAFPSIMESDAEHLVLLTRIMLLQPLLLGFSNIFATITQARRRFLLFSVSPVLYNIGIIVGIVVLYPLMGIQGLAWGVVLGALLHVLAPIPSIIADGFLQFRGPLISLASFMRTILISLPRTLALSSGQLVFFLLVAFAGTMTTGSIAVFIFAFNLQSVPLAVIGVSYSVAAFPALVAIYSAGRRNEFVEQVAIAARHIIFWTLPVIALVIVLRAHVVRVLLGTGEFDWSDTRLTAAALACFMLALSAHALMSLLARSYYAAGRSWTPFFVNVGSGIATVLLALYWIGQFGNPGPVHEVLEALLRVSGVPGTEMLALPLAYAAGAVVGTLALMIFFEIDFHGLFARILRTFVEGCIAAFIGGFAAYTALQFLGGISEATTLPAVFFHGLIAGTIGLTAIVGSHALMRSKELREVRVAFARRIGGKQAPVVSSEDEPGVSAS